MIAHRRATATTSPSTTAPGPSLGLIPAPPGLTTKLKRSTPTVRAGTPARATVVVKNAADDPIDLTVLAGGCQPQFGITITNAKLPFGATAGGFPSVCTGEPLNGVDFPACDPSSGRPVALPPGKYTTLFVASGKLALPSPPAQTLHLRA